MKKDHFENEENRVLPIFLRVTGLGKSLPHPLHIPELTVIRGRTNECSEILEVGNLKTYGNIDIASRNPVLVIMERDQTFDHKIYSGGIKHTGGKGVVIFCLAIKVESHTPIRLSSLQFKNDWF